MNKILTAIFLLFAFLTLKAQNYTVTFQVDMSMENIADTISVAGDFQAAAGYPTDWTPGSTILTDPNNDSIYSVTVSLPAGTYRYQFINGTVWGQHETVPGACAVGGNREIVVSGNTIIPFVCYGHCDPCPEPKDTVSVTFQVDMSNESVSTVVSVAGSFQSSIVGLSSGNWTPGDIVLTDSNNDSIYEITLNIIEGDYEYRFLNGSAWGTEETVPVACSFNNNRQLHVEGPGPIVIPSHCFSSCISCQPPLPPINVTFRVNMNNETVSPDGVYLAGSFDPIWDKDSLLMTDIDMDGIYEFTKLLFPNEYQYKFYNGDGGDSDQETYNFLADGCGTGNGLGGFNRFVYLEGVTHDTILPVYYYNSCNTSSGLSTYSFDNNSIDFKIYPNPFSDYTTIEIDNDSENEYTIRIFNLNGQLVREIQNIKEKITRIERNGLSSGLYFMEIRNERSSVTKKLLIK